MPNHVTTPITTTTGETTTLISFTAAHVDALIELIDAPAGSSNDFVDGMDYLATHLADHLEGN